MEHIDAKKIEEELNEWQFDDEHDELIDQFSELINKVVAKRLIFMFSGDELSLSNNIELKPKAAAASEWVITSAFFDVNFFQYGRSAQKHLSELLNDEIDNAPQEYLPSLRGCLSKAIKRMDDRNK